MICAAIDVGSNTIRMLLAEKKHQQLIHPRYFRQVTRLAQNHSAQHYLSADSIERSLHTLESYARHLDDLQVTDVRAVGTAALRHARNATEFLRQVKLKTGLDIEIIDGETEAELSSSGILSVIDPPPTRALMFDIGGGSTEFILFESGRICHQTSLPLGVVRLFEQFDNPEDCRNTIIQSLAPFLADPRLRKWQQDSQPVDLIGTAGTVTTLAAMKLKMTEYDSTRVNNQLLSKNWLQQTARMLERSSLEQRQQLAGLEQGRDDIIYPGIQLVILLLELLSCDSVRVSDAGLLEGLLLS